MREQTQRESSYDPTRDVTLFKLEEEGGLQVSLRQYGSRGQLKVQIGPKPVGEHYSHSIRLTFAEMRWLVEQWPLLQEKFSR